jgi:hypothetical protein
MTPNLIKDPTSIACALEAAARELLQLDADLRRALREVDRQTPLDMPTTGLALVASHAANRLAVHAAGLAATADRIRATVTYLKAASDFVLTPETGTEGRRRC